MSQPLPNPRRYAILGTGALGGFYGGRLQRSGVEVHFLLHRDYDYVCQQGLLIESCEGNFHLPQINAHCTTATMPSCDVVIVALKAVQNGLLPQLLPPVVGQFGVVVLMQNGLGGEELIAEIVGPDRVLGGLCFLSANKVGPGHIRHLDYGFIQLGDFTKGYQACGITPRMY